MIKVMIYKETTYKINNREKYKLNNYSKESDDVY